MKKMTVVLCVAALLATACKTSEANYRAAYEKTMEARRAEQSVDSTVYGGVRRQDNTRSVEVEQGVSTDVRVQHVRVTEGGGGINENLRRYGVVVGQFKQRFNAISLRNRLVDAGYPAAFVVETAEPYYYILLGSYSELPEAYAAMKSFEAKPAIAMKEPLPFILQASGRK
ncbi:MAG: SPOR domain-containing protein [Muribaculaceae bacterium]|nr:SPOR domain-containing protein [Muribaculaceae bacterium]